MFTIIAAPTSMNFNRPRLTATYTEPQFLHDSQTLVDLCRQLNLNQLEEVMKISPHLARLNQQRFQDWHTPFTPDNALQAIFAYEGDIYRSLDVGDFSTEDLHYTQNNVLILSGLYGLLRPLDLIQPYRLTMNTRLENPKGINLYHFWQQILTDYLNQLPTDLLIDLAFDEYFKVVDKKALKAKVIKPVFLDEKDGKYMNVNAYSKEAMGLMTRFIIKHWLTSPKDLIDFSLHGYRFDQTESTEQQWIFRRSAKTAAEYPPL
ncbi:peroxide stress protein YaaA [Neisseriaceae bacterium ESL0693]|nr:peroxide stress protein YaaA [Neisseriaceae bacterium ESL0693]